MGIEYINPENMVPPRGYSHAVSVSGSQRTIYVGGQNSINEKGELVGKDNLKEQTEQILSNIEKILAKAGTKLENVVKFGIFLVQGQNPQAGFQVFQKKWKSSNLPAITVVFVAGLGNPEWLAEIDAIAVVPV